MSSFRLHCYHVRSIILANNVDPDEISRSMASRLGLHYSAKYLLIGFQSQFCYIKNWKKEDMILYCSDT